MSIYLGFLGASQLSEGHFLNSCSSIDTQSSAIATEANRATLSDTTKQQCAHVLGWAVDKELRALKRSGRKIHPGLEARQHVLSAMCFPSAQAAEQSIPRDYLNVYDYTLKIQRTDPTLINRGLKYVKLPFLQVFFMVEAICIRHFFSSIPNRLTYELAKRELLSANDAILNAWRQAVHNTCIPPPDNFVIADVYRRLVLRYLHVYQGVFERTHLPVFKEQQLRLQLLARQAKDRDGDDPMPDISDALPRRRTGAPRVRIDV